MLTNNHNDYAYIIGIACQPYNVRMNTTFLNHIDLNLNLYYEMGN